VEDSEKGKIGGKGRDLLVSGCAEAVAGDAVTFFEGHGVSCDERGRSQCFVDGCQEGPCGGSVVGKVDDIDSVGCVVGWPGEERRGLSSWAWEGGDDAGRGEQETEESFDLNHFENLVRDSGLWKREKAEYRR
jgi:hypothetical protein